MADITLAEFNGRVFLVGGEAYLADLLANTLASNVSIELVQCERQSEVQALWVRNCGQLEPGIGGMPWTIHPAIVARIRRSAPGYTVFFAQWSAMLDADALAVIDAAALWASSNPEAPVRIVEYVDDGAPAASATLAGLRAELIEQRLETGGIPRGRLTRARRPTSEASGMGADSQRVDIVVDAA